MEVRQQGFFNKFLECYLKRPTLIRRDVELIIKRPSILLIIGPVDHLVCPIELRQSTHTVTDKIMIGISIQVVRASLQVIKIYFDVVDTL